MEALVILIIFGSILGMIVIPMWLRERTKQSAHRIIADAIARGEKLDADMLSRLTEPPRPAQPDRARRSLGSAVIMIALAGALAASSFFTGDFDPTGHAWGGQMTAAVILGALGLAFLVLALVDYNSKPRNGSANPPSNP
ncbi:MAG: hypothetical protein AB7J28_12775 [Hyphomonadaceae bacterium]